MSDDLDRLFHALSDATRRDIVAQVMRQEQSVSALAARYAMSFAAVQKHVTVLEKAALVSKHRRGREQIVSGNPQSILRAREALERYEEIWQGRTERMRAILLDDPTSTTAPPYRALSETSPTSPSVAPVTVAPPPTAALPHRDTPSPDIAPTRPPTITSPKGPTPCP